MKRLDLKDKKFHKLLVIGKAENQKHKTMWKCLCDCGNITFVTTSNLKANRVKSCGCLRIDQLVERSTTHNKRHISLYEIWKGIKQRCFNPKSKAYKNYGGRGIIMCEDWKNNFEEFYNWSISNGYVKGLTIDRIDNNSNYCPNNCRWVSRLEQANNKRNTIYLTINNKTDSLSNWLRFYNVNRSTYMTRIKYGKTPEQALGLK